MSPVKLDSDYLPVAVMSFVAGFILAAVVIARVLGWLR